MDKQQGPTVPYREHSTGNSAQCYMVAWMGRVWGRMVVIGGLATKSCPTPANPGTVACRTPLCSVYGISPAGILE